MYQRITDTKRIERGMTICVVTPMDGIGGWMTVSGVVEYRTVFDIALTAVRIEYMEMTQMVNLETPDQFDIDIQNSALRIYRVV